MKKVINIIVFCIIILSISCAWSEGLATSTDVSNASEVIVYIEEPEIHLDIRIWFEDIKRPKIGDTIHIYSEVLGGEGREMIYQWQYLDPRINDPMSEIGWVNIPGANEPIYEFVIDEENAWYYYRLQVTHWREIK